MGSILLVKCTRKLLPLALRDVDMLKCRVEGGKTSSRLYQTGQRDAFYVEVKHLVAITGLRGELSGISNSSLVVATEPDRASLYIVHINSVHLLIYEFFSVEGFQ